MCLPELLAVSCALENLHGLSKSVKTRRTTPVHVFVSKDLKNFHRAKGKLRASTSLVPRLPMARDLRSKNLPQNPSISPENSLQFRLLLARETAKKVLTGVFLLKSFATTMKKSIEGLALKVECYISCAILFPYRPDGEHENYRDSKMHFGERKSKL